MFNYALNRLPSERMLRKLYHQTPVRYYSKRNLIRQVGLSLHGIALSSGRGVLLCTCWLWSARKSSCPVIAGYRVETVG